MTSYPPESPKSEEQLPGTSRNTDAGSEYKQTLASNRESLDDETKKRSIENRLSDLSKKARLIGDQTIVVRELMQWIGVSRRRSRTTQKIREHLSEHNLVSEPDIANININSQITIKYLEEHNFVEHIPDSAQSDAEHATRSNLAPAHSNQADHSKPVGSSETTSGTLPTKPAREAHDDPTYRIHTLEAAEALPASAQPDTPIEEIVSTLEHQKLTHIPVFSGTTNKDIKGIVSWKSIAQALFHKDSCVKARDCMEPVHEISKEHSILGSLDGILEHNHALVRARDKQITGIITAKDLAMVFHEYGRIFLIIEEIERHIRQIIDQKISPEEIQSAILSEQNQKNERDLNIEEEISADSLTFGQYISILSRKELWAKLSVKIDRKYFIEQLSDINQIRNRTMHFDPDGINAKETRALVDFVDFLRQHHSMGTWW